RSRDGSGRSTPAWEPRSATHSRSSSPAAPPDRSSAWPRTFCATPEDPCSRATGATRPPAGADNRGCTDRRAVQRSIMAPEFSELLKLPASTRAELAMALWESLSHEEREAELVITPEQAYELDRRWADHLANPRSAIPWEDVLRKLRS